MARTISWSVLPLLVVGGVFLVFTRACVTDTDLPDPTGVENPGDPAAGSAKAAPDGGIDTPRAPVSDVVEGQAEVFPSDIIPGETVPGETVPGETVPGDVVQDRTLPSTDVPREPLPSPEPVEDPIPADPSMEP
jgi:hypothetical protein